MAGRARESDSPRRLSGVPNGADARPAPRASLVDAEDRFVAAWGQMGSTWGVSRTMAEAHALLFITGRPLCTDEVMERLEISRGNASMSLRALLDWGIVTRVHKRGDRKEYFEAEQDPWRLVQLVVRERMKREVHPVLAALAELRDAPIPEAAAPSPAPRVTKGEPPGLGSSHAPAGAAGADAYHARLDAMMALLSVFDRLGERFVEAQPAELRDMARALAARDEGPAVPARRDGP